MACHTSTLRMRLAGLCWWWRFWVLGWLRQKVTWTDPGEYGGDRMTNFPPETRKSSPRKASTHRPSSASTHSPAKHTHIRHLTLHTMTAANALKGNTAPQVRSLVSPPIPPMPPATSPRRTPSQWNPEKLTRGPTNSTASSSATATLSRRTTSASTRAAARATPSASTPARRTPRVCRSFSRRGRRSSRC